jgi:hypothetical protein
LRRITLFPSWLVPALSGRMGSEIVQKIYM